MESRKKDLCLYRVEKAKDDTKQQLENAGQFVEKLEEFIRKKLDDM